MLTKVTVTNKNEVDTKQARRPTIAINVLNTKKVINSKKTPNKKKVINTKVTNQHAINTTIVNTKKNVINSNKSPNKTTNKTSKYAIDTTIAITK